MKRFLDFGLLILLFIMACGGVPGLNPTATSVPTNTPQPSSTPPPTDTPTPSPTATPDVTATAGAKATEAAESVLGELDELLKEVDIQYKDGHLAWQQTKPLMINLSGPDDQILAVDDQLTA